MDIEYKRLWLCEGLTLQETGEWRKVNRGRSFMPTFVFKPITHLRRSVIQHVHLSRLTRMGIIMVMARSIGRRRKSTHVVAGSVS